MDEAIEKRAKEVEVIPGKGSGALKAVLRFLDRPEVRVHSTESRKTGTTGGGCLSTSVEREQAAKAVPVPSETAGFDCFCCQTAVRLPLDREALPETRVVECPACGSPNRVVLSLDRRGQVTAAPAESGYEDQENNRCSRDNWGRTGRWSGRWGWARCPCPCGGSSPQQRRTPSVSCAAPPRWA